MPSEFPVAADQLKKLIKQSLRMPIPFGFNPGLSEENDEYLAAHPRKSPELMARIALNEGAGSKVTFGTFALSDRELHLSCFREIPKLAKRFKRFLKANKIILNVVVLNEDGEVIDSDIEDLVGAFIVEDDGDDDEDETPPAAAETSAAAPAPAAAAAPAPAAPPRPRSIDPAVAAAARLSDRLKRLQPQVLAAPGPVAQKLGTLFKAAVAQVREGKLKEGAAAIAALEATFAKIGKPAGDAAPAAQPARDPRLPKLRDALLRIEDRALALLGDAAEMILGDLEPLAAQIDLGEGDAVMQALRTAQAQIAAAAGAKAKWEEAFARLSPRVEAALKGPSPAALRNRWKFACGLAEVGDWPRAISALPGLVQLLKNAAGGLAPDPAQMSALWQAAFETAEGAGKAAMARAGAQLEAVFDALRDAADSAERQALHAQAAGLVAGVRAGMAA